MDIRLREGKRHKKKRGLRKYRGKRKWRDLKNSMGLKLSILTKKRRLRSHLSSQLNKSSTK